MIDQSFPTMQTLSQYWSRAVTGMVRSQWIMLDTGLRAAQTILTSASTLPPGVSSRPGASTTAAPGAPEALINLAMERMTKGLAPPREIYQAHYRNRIDWSRFPDWARPSDPELFEGSAHEG